MVTLVPRPPAYQTAEEISLVQQILQGYRETVIEVNLRVTACEIKYNLRSSEVHEAIDDGRIEENAEVCSWLIDIDRLNRLVRD